MLNNKKIVTFLNSPLSNIVVSPLGAKKGNLFGVELEVEGHNVAMEGIPTKGWKRVAEGSLRGENTEYVFSAPVDFAKSNEMVANLFRLFKQNGVILNNSHRTSTHVHLNFSDKTVKNVVTFFLIHTILEELLASYCGETRRGNLFCISTRSNEQLVNSLERAVTLVQNFRDFGNNIRYCAANLAALNKFGTIEIRTMRGADSEQQVKDWLSILNQLYEYSCKEDVPAPARLLESLSHLGAQGFLSQFFDQASIIKLLAAWPRDHDLHQSLMDGVRLVQMFAYRLDETWNAEAPKIAAKKERAGDDDFLDNPNEGFCARAIRGARDQMRGMDALYTPQLVAGIWWIAHNDTRVNISGRAARKNAMDGVWRYVDDNEPIRYIVKDDTLLYYGEEDEQAVNAGYYEQHGIIVHNDDWDVIDDEDFVPDFGE